MLDKVTGDMYTDGSWSLGGHDEAHMDNFEEHYLDWEHMNGPDYAHNTTTFCARSTTLQWGGSHSATTMQWLADPLIPDMAPPLLDIPPYAASDTRRRPSATPDPHSRMPKVEKTIHRKRRAPKVSKLRFDLQAAVDQALASLTAPLSELTKDSKIPLDDADAFAARPTDERVRDRTAPNGKIRRPLNMYFLYRKAYAGRIKEHFNITNHQVVSIIAGASWREMESDEFKAQYSAMGRTESEQHGAAFANYKYCPTSKGRGSNKSVKGKARAQEPSDAARLPFGPTPSSQVSRQCGAVFDPSHLSMLEPRQFRMPNHMPDMVIGPSTLR